jgi:GT2 family glycosyltransferase/Flp pilus assembly protein TadD
LLKLDEKLIQVQHSSPAPLVSVIIPTLNRPAMLDEAIQSVLRQTFPDFEIIVINDAGVDVGNVIEKYNPKRQIIYLQHNSNRGMAAARNTGIKVARGKYIAYLDDDDVYYPDHLETLINFLESSEYKVAYTDAFRAFQTFQNGQYITIKKDVPYSFDFDYERILKENFIPVLCIIHEKSCLDSVGMFDETLRAHEDWDLWMRMSRLFKFAHIKKVTCEFSWRQDGSSMTFGRKGDMETTRQIVFQRGQKLLKEGYYEPKIMKLQINADYEYKNIKPFIDSGRCQEAIVSLEKIITSYPEYSPAHSDLGVLYYHQGNKEKSIIHHEKAVSLNPGNPIFLKNLGDFYYVELKKIDEAIHLYQKVLAINPVDLETLLILGNIHAELKKFDEARSYYTKALEIDPSNELARKCVKAFPRRNPFEAAEDDPEEDYREARILIQSGKEDKAIHKLEKLIHAHPRHALAHNDLGYLYYNRGERIKALAHYEKAVELNPENLTPMKNLADFYYVELKRIDEAIHLYEKVLSIHPMDGETLLILGNIHVESGKFFDAKAYYLRVLEIDPSNELASKMAEALERRQQEAGVDLDRENIAGKNLDAIAGLDSEGLQTRKESLRRKVSIIIPVFNKVEYTQKCLTAIFRNTENNLYEIVVVDNASTDGTGKYLKELGDKVKFLTNRENLGFAKACNQGAAIASSEYLLFLNNDTEPKPKWLEPLVNLLDGSVSIAAVGSKLLFPDGTIQHAGIAIIEDRKLPDPLVARHLYYRQPSDLPEANVPRQYQALTAACLLIRKDAFDEVKGFDEGYWNGYEDVDLCFKLRERGWRLIYQPESDVIHFESQSGKERFAKISKNISRLHEKWLGKVKPDLIIEKDGTAKETRAAGILPYSMVKRPEVILQSSHQQEKRISIVILTFNQLEYTKKCVESIRKHTPVPHEIIFVDNASKDGTIKWLKKLTQENPNFKLIENKKNLGFSKGCNQGITASSGEYILLLNNDILVTEGWLSGMLECINSSPDIGVVGPMTNNISGLQRVLSADYGDMGNLEGYARAFREKNRYRRILTRRIVGFCMLFRRELVEKIGLLDETFGSGNYEDDDFCLRLSLEGYRNLIAGDVFVHHYGSRSFIGNRIDYNSSMLANRKIFNEKWNGLDAQSALGKKALSLKAMEKADELNQKGQNEEAVNIIIGGIKLFPDDGNLYYALSEMLIDFKKYKDALGILNEMPANNDDTRKLGLIGYCKEGMELYEEAQEYADRALLLNPTSPLALNLKGMLAYKKGDKIKAEGFFKKAIEADPGYGEPYTNLGVLNWVAEQKEEALKFLEKGFILSPTITDIVTAYYSAIINMGEFSRAEMVFREAKGLYPLNRRIAFLLIDLLIQQGKHQKAMENIEEAMIVFGVDDGILKAAIEIRKGIGPKEINVQTKGKSSLSLCMIVKNEEQDLPRCLGSVEPVVDEMIVADTGSTDKTKEIAQAFGAKVYELAWPDSFADARNYSISQASGQWILVMDADEVLSKRDYDRLANTVKNGSPSSLAYSFITRNYVNRSNVEGWRENDGAYSAEEAGIGWFPSQKVRLLPNDKRIRFENPVHEFVEASLRRAGIDIKLGNILIHHYGKLNEEKSFFKGETYYNLGARKLEEMGSNAFALRELAIQAAELKKYDEAVELWKKIILLKPDNASAYLNLGHSYLELGRFEDALLASKKAMELDPKMREAVHNYCVCELCSGQVQNVIAALERLLKRVPEYPSAIGLLGVAYIIDGRTKMGLEYIEKIWKNKTDASEYLFNTTARLLKAGKMDYAVSLLEAAVESKSVNNAILALREECKKIAEFRNECGQKEKISVPAQV